MEFNSDVRLKQLESLEQYISSSRDKIQSILDCLKWNVNDVCKDSQLVTCSVDPSHRVESKTADNHVRKCSVKKEGYTLNDQFLSEPTHDLNNSVLIDDHKKIEILSAAHKNVSNFKSGWNGQDPDPKTADRLLTTFSTDERLALYDYSVTNTVGFTKLPEFNTIQPINTSDRPLTYEEIQIKLRDAKRRRIKYKSIHTNQKNHTEILRELINSQMEQYTDWVKGNSLVEDTKYDEPTEDSSNIKEDTQNSDEKQSCGSQGDSYERSHSVISRNSTHSSGSKSRSVKYYNHNDKYEQTRPSNDRYRRRSRSRDRYDKNSYRRSRSRSKSRRYRRENYDSSRHR